MDFIQRGNSQVQLFLCRQPGKGNLQLMTPQFWWMWRMQC